MAEDAPGLNPTVLTVDGTTCASALTLLTVMASFQLLHPSSGISGTNTLVVRMHPRSSQMFRKSSTIIFTVTLSTKPPITQIIPILRVTLCSAYFLVSSLGMSCGGLRALFCIVLDAAVYTSYTFISSLTVALYPLSNNIIAPELLNRCRSCLCHRGREGDRVLLGRFVVLLLLLCCSKYTGPSSDIVSCTYSS
ncbi:hypothetical protein P692DRAFT_20297051 [Suillus brevipes Sb2]|nr:hypothetical protein P692DRAFT_20297051 [Suillus brevipes Sb2]